MSISIPIQHGGDGEYPCPIELLLSSLGSCLLGTFQLFQGRLRLRMQDLQISIRGSVDMIKAGKDQGKYELTDIDVFIHVTIEGDEYEAEVAGDCIRLTEEHCPVTRTLKKAVPITVKSKIETLPK